MINNSKKIEQKSQFISFEGGEASGKSTQVLMLKNYLQKQKINVISTKEPGGTNLANSIRNLILSQEISDPLTESLIIAAARRDHIKKIKQHLKNEDYVISDRYIDSFIVYQGIVKGLDEKIINKLIEWTTEGLKPNITILLDIDVDNMMKRIKGSENHNTFYDNKNFDFHQKIRNGFLEIASKSAERIKIVDGNKTKEEVHTDILSILNI
ncbi:dTMP kinase [Lyticum sinuosum]|uniref:Thymidylate kinase n=1 Tax=Lyticum sinuosum TaxID=1332059 RepID=A0AAE5AHR1_9RICK|nr:dTMP kinase [Lyticum sinuosum]MDZ5761433.1 Thymidylate kinase [Lyticum sinuosum]